MNSESPLDSSLVDTPAFIIVGRNGAGKSTLVNKIFGQDVAEVGDRTDVTSGIVKYSLPNTGVIIYDTPGAGGLDVEAEKLMRLFLLLEDDNDKESIPADLIIFIFTFERLSRQEFAFFREMDAIFRNRLILVKNYRKKESEADRDQNLMDIELETGRCPIAVDAKHGTNLDELIREIFRLLPMKKLRKFNDSQDCQRRKARDLSRLYTLKAASQAVIIRNENPSIVCNKITNVKEQLAELIHDAYIEETMDEDYISTIMNKEARIVMEDFQGERGAAGALGGGIGMLVGALAGPIGMGLGALAGALFGASSVKNVARGGAPAAVNVMAQGYGLSEIIEEALKDPQVLLSQSETHIKNWIRTNKITIKGFLQEADTRSRYGIQEYALIHYLNKPTTNDPLDVEFNLDPVVKWVFKTSEKKSLE